jgi:hypothetical protein
MAYVKSFQHDVFISYAHADNAPDVSGKGWVAEFVAHLECALKQRLGGTDALKIFFDSRNLNSNQQLHELLGAARNSAIFVAVASRSYASRDWTKRELETFSETADDLRRLFAIECLPLDEGQTYPAPLHEHNRLVFWHIDEPYSLTPMPLSPSLEANAFHPRVHDLAEQIRRQLVVLNASGARNTSLSDKAKVSPSSQAEQSGNTKRVLLAQVTDDLEEDREQLRRYLQQFGVPVFPERTYPQGGHEFQAAFAHDLAQADIFVQLLGPVAGKIPPDLPQGYTRFQLEAAVGRGLEIVQWRRPDLSMELVSNVEYRALLTAETVIASGLESFKADVLRRARTVNLSPKESQSSLVFINADRSDQAIAQAIQSEFSRHRVPTIVPTLEGPAEEVRADLEENLVDCDALVLVYGDTTPLWVRGQLRLYNKIRPKRSTPLRVLAIYTGPPSDKPDIGFNFPDVRLIDCRDAGRLEPILSLIEELNR